MKADFYPDKPFYKPPEALPAGFFEVVQPIAEWFFKQLVQAYDDGYSTGRTDAGYLAIKRMDEVEMHSGKGRNRKPPTGAAVVTPA